MYVYMPAKSSELSIVGSVKLTYCCLCAASCISAIHTTTNCQYSYTVAIAGSMVSMHTENIFNHYLALSISYAGIIYIAICLMLISIQIKGLLASYIILYYA